MKNKYLSFAVYYLPFIFHWKIDKSRNHWKTENRKWKIQKGFTVVELLVYMALLTIFLLVLLDIFTTTLNFKLQNEAVNTLNQDARSILGNFNYNIYNSGTASVISGSKLSLDSGDKVYELVNGDLLLNSVKLNSLDTKVQDISFTKIGQTVRIIFTLESQITTKGGPKTQNITTTLGLRY